MDRLFVYGTLMPGEALWGELAPFVIAWREAAAPGRMWDTGHGYPAVRFVPSGAPVPGVVVDLDPVRAPAAITRLDEVEDAGVLYRRVEVVTTAGPAWAYEWLGPTGGLQPLPGGWRRD
ncbi:MAG: gamma-glutamylcyclotransferase family protein [Acidimicrobiales bacterium]